MNLLESLSQDSNETLSVFIVPHLHLYCSRQLCWLQELRILSLIMAAQRRGAIINVKWADVERKVFFTVINAVLNLTPLGKGTLSKSPRGSGLLKRAL